MSREAVTVYEQVIQKVATATNSEPLELPPLYGTIDRDALNVHIEQMTDGEVSFTYAGQEITVESDGTIDFEKRPVAVRRQM